MVHRALATLPALGDPAHQLGASSVIYDRAGQEVAIVPSPTDRQPVPIGQIPPLVQHAFIAVEDRRFYQNQGIDIRSILRAFLVDITGHALQGGSTIAQQLARNIYLTQADTISRKIKEAVLALELNRRYTKPEILDMYLNWIYLGEHAYGIEAAAETYFGVPVGRLTLPETALLAGLPQAPVGYDPYFHAARALARRNTVLAIMAQQHYITAKQAVAAEAAPLGIQPRAKSQSTNATYPYPWFLDAVISQLENTYHLSPEQVTSGGLQIYTTLVPRIYDAAQRAVNRLQQFFPLTGRNPMQAAVAVLDQSNGDVVAIIGGRQHTAMLEYDRALYAERQPGSAIKPLVDYIPALEDGLTAGTVLDDRVFAYNMGAHQPSYVPTNDELPYYGLTTLTEALRRSVNTVAVQLLAHVGVRTGWADAIRMGLPLTTRDRHLALALGRTVDCCTALNMATAYATIANGGARVSPRIITRVVGPDGAVLVDNPPHIRQVLDPRVAFVMTQMLMTVDEPQSANGWDANWGTGYDASVHDEVPGWPTAAKTGTSNSNRDAWYVGFTPLYTAAVWLGDDTPGPFPGLFGGTYAGPIFRTTMEAAVRPYRPIPFRRPAGVTQAPIDTKAAPWTVAKPGPLTPSRWVREAWFVDGTQPTHTNPLWVQEQVDSTDPTTLYEPGCPGRPETRTFLDRPPLGVAWAKTVAGALGGTWTDYVPADMSLAPPTRACNGGSVSPLAIHYELWYSAPGYRGTGGKYGGPLVPSPGRPAPAAGRSTQSGVSSAPATAQTRPHRPAATSASSAAGTGRTVSERPTASATTQPGATKPAKPRGGTASGLSGSAAGARTAPTRPTLTRARAHASGTTPALTCQSDWHVTLRHGHTPTPAVLCVPEGQSVFITFVATDGRVHDMLISGYGEEAVVPANGTPVTLNFVANSAGRFTVQDALDPAETATLRVIRTSPAPPG